MNTATKLTDFIDPKNFIVTTRSSFKFIPQSSIFIPDLSSYKNLNQSINN